MGRADEKVSTRRYLFRDLAPFVGPVLLLIGWLLTVRDIPGNITRIEQNIRELRDADQTTIGLLQQHLRDAAARDNQVRVNTERLRECCPISSGRGR
jgi:hypothetical protein